MDIVRWIIDADRKDMGDESDGGGDDSDEWDDFYPRAFGQDFPITSLGGEASLAVGAAAMGGHLEVAKYLHERVATPKTERESEREEGRFRRTLKYISRQIDMFDADKVSVDTMLVAAQNGHLDVVKWLYAEFSVKLGMDMFWLYDDDADKYFSVLDVAAGNGRLEVVKYLHEICQEAAGNAEDQDGLDTGDESMRSGDSIFSDDSWAEEPTKPGCTAAAMDGAAANGHMDVVQWLHRNRNEGCTMDAMDSAAGNGHLDMVKWLHEHTKMGCTTKAMDAAARGGHLEVVKWLHEHTDEGCTSKAMDGAVHSGALDVVKWLHKNLSEGCSKAMVNEAAKRGHLRVLRWLNMNYPADWSTAAMDNAAMGGHFEVVLLLHRVRSEGCSPGPVHMKSPSFDIERWLIEHYPTRMVVSSIPAALLLFQQTGRSLSSTPGGLRRSVDEERLFVFPTW
ncbi:hypothetical protein PF007_g20240 [Phytophthora fragariae]|uniref:Uncharacterized protein n=1 Tax=Phytophthora fragariae TaxID=53985 RepID=A0A6A3R206_9STRA|nr:hypothetical protein PF007_g20240 [Phytophthora fragariae]